MKKNFELIKPFIVLVSISVVVGLLLAFTNYVTAPIIEKNAAEKAKATRVSVLSEAEDFVQIEADPDWDVNDVYEGIRDGEKVGIVVSVTRKGYKSVSVTVGIDNDGKIVGMEVDASAETSGIGSKVGEDGYVSEFLGLTGNSDGVDIISQATYSSRAVKECVNAALLVFDEMGGAE